MYVGEIFCGSVIWIEVAQNMVQLKYFVITIMNF